MYPKQFTNCIDNIAEIRQDVATLKVNVIEIQRELQDLNEKIARASINDFFIYNLIYFILLFIYYS